MMKSLVFAVLDGWGYSTRQHGNPIQKAHKPTMDFLANHFPMVLLMASGLAVGLQWKELGNSETGHLNLGAGRIVLQYQTRIQKSIKNGSFLSNDALRGAFLYAQQNKSHVHLIGLLTSGSVHADYSHIIALLDVASSIEFKDVYLHLFFDGKDSGQKEGLGLLQKTSEEIAARGFGTVATIIGRNFSMDRDKHWNLTQKTHDLIANARGEQTEDFAAAIAQRYEQGVVDTDIPPLVNKSFNGLSAQDALIFFNFREDSMKQLFSSFADPDFSNFPRQQPKPLYCASMTQYVHELSTPVAFMPPDVKNNLPEYLSSHGLAQFHIAETLKYAHVTFFFNGIKHNPYPGEDDELIPSVENNEERPAMRALDIAQRVVSVLDEQKYQFILINFANADVLAHTGNYVATVAGIEAIDKAVCIVKDAVLKHDGLMVITADHGNAERLIYSGSGEPESKHDESPVPFILVGKEFEQQKTPDRIARESSEASGVLGDAAPTVLELLGLPKPPEMTGTSLLPRLITK